VSTFRIRDLWFNPPIKSASRHFGESGIQPFKRNANCFISIRKCLSEILSALPVDVFNVGFAGLGLRAYLAHKDGSEPAFELFSCSNEALKNVVIYGNHVWEHPKYRACMAGFESNYESSSLMRSASSRQNRKPAIWPVYDL